MCSVRMNTNYTKKISLGNRCVTVEIMHILTLVGSAPETKDSLVEMFMNATSQFRKEITVELNVHHFLYLQASAILDHSIRLLGADLICLTPSCLHQLCLQC
jgi:hypothetical protein